MVVVVEVSVAFMLNNSLTHDEHYKVMMINGKVVLVVIMYNCYY